MSHGLNRLRFLLNDPLFLRTPKGMTPTARALELAESIADILARVRRVVATAEPFDPARSGRRFMIGAPDGTAAVLLPPLLWEIQRTAPRIDIGMRHVLRDTAIAELDAHLVDIVMVSLDEIPARFVPQDHFRRRLCDCIARWPSLRGSADTGQLLRHETPRGVDHRRTAPPIDDLLAHEDRSRRVALTVPNFMLALRCSPRPI